MARRALARDPDPADVTVAHADRWLVARFGAVHATASWAIVGGGLHQTRTIAWHQVTDDELRPPVDALALFRQRLRERDLGDAVGLLTSRSLASYTDLAVAYGDLTARCVVTVGLGNALRAGDLPGSSGRIGTINVLCRISVPLSPEALLEALALATEARTLAVREGSIASVRSGEPASGTGTDCVVIAAPRDGTRLRYAGKHTAIGHVIGASVRDATAIGVAAWQREQGNR